MEKIPPGDSKLTYVYDNYLFHYISDSHLGVVYLAMADNEFGRRVPFAFLEDIKTKFEAKYDQNRIEMATGYGLQEFAGVLEERVGYFNGDPGADRFRQAQAEIDQVKDVMVQNIVGLGALFHTGRIAEL